MAFGRAHVVRRLMALGLLVCGATIVAALGLSLLAGQGYDARLGLQAERMLFTPTNMNAFFACPPTTHVDTQAPTTVTTRGAVTTFQAHGHVQALSNRQLTRKAECLRRRGLITEQTLAAIREQSSQPHSELVPWWAPTNVVPSWGAVLVWSLLLLVELAGLAALLRANSTARDGPNAGAQIRSG